MGPGRRHRLRPLHVPRSSRERPIRVTDSSAPGPGQFFLMGRVPRTDAVTDEGAPEEHGDRAASQLRPTSAVGPVTVPSAPMEKPVQRLAACVLAALAFVLLGAPSSQAGTSSLRYVALGDSYSAASGVLPPDPEAPPACMRSTGNYPHILAAGDRRPAHGRDLRRGRDRGLLQLAVPGRRAAAGRARRGHPAG